jgi:predicted transcriptional regulator
MSDADSIARWRAESLATVREAHEKVRQANAAVRLARTELMERAAAARSVGVTLAEIGRTIGVTRQRIHEMLK